MEEHDEGPIQTFWGLKIPHGTKLKLPVDDECYTVATNVAFGEISKETPSKIFAHVNTVLIDEEKNGEAPTEQNEIMIAHLIPGKTENAILNITFSPLNTVFIENKGENDVYISGSYAPYDFDDEEEEEEDHEEEEIDEKELNKKILESLSKKKVQK